jgi:hypothetical protein
VRLWTVHPKYLDARGLVAVWREGLLARAVLRDRTLGYRHHPQLARFRARPDPVACLNAYLRVIYAEALGRGYRFDAAKSGGCSLDARSRRRGTSSPTNGRTSGASWSNETPSAARRWCALDGCSPIPCSRSGPDQCARGSAPHESGALATHP